MVAAIDWTTLMSVAGGVALLLLGMALGGLFLLGSGTMGLSGRLRQLAADYGPESDAQGGGGMAIHSSMRDMMLGGLENVSQALGGFNLIGEKQREQFRVLLLRAGIRRADGLRMLVTIKVMSILGCLVVAVATAMAMGLSATGMGVAMIAGALVGAIAPERILTMRANARQRRIAQRLPDALDLLIIFANAGYGLDQAIRQLSAEIHRSSPELGDELAVTSDELRMLTDRNQALENFAERTALQPVRILVSALIQAQKYGTPLSQALRVLAAEMRNTQIMEIEERAARMPVMITVPLIVLILPALFLVVATPAYIQAKNSWPSHKVGAPPAQSR